MYNLYKVFNTETHTANPVLDTIINNRVTSFKTRNTINDITDISLLKDIDIATTILMDNMANQNHIFCNTDLDCDGVTSASIFYLIMVKIFNYPKDKITIFTNERRYKRGINNEVLGIVDKVKPSLFITADHGSGDNDYIKRLKEKGIETIITDHHLFDNYPTNADAFLNPQQDGCKYDKTISGAIVLYLLLLNTYNKLKEKSYTLSNIDVREILPICAISTLGDRMDVSTPTNRGLIQDGITIINTSPLWSNFKKLYGKGNDISQNTLDFDIIPSINSGGRMGNSRTGFEMLSRVFDEDLSKYVRKLNKSNKDRKIQQQQLSIEVYKQYDKDKFKNVIFITTNTLNGVNGLIAGNLVERYNKPSLVGSIDNGIIYASARSVGNIAFLNKVKAYGSKNEYVTANGHQMAFGLQIPVDKYDIFVKEINKEIDASRVSKIYNVDSDTIIPTIQLVEDLKKLEPYGTGFTKPLFAMVGNIINMRLIGKNKEHMIFTILDTIGGYDAIWFNYTKDNINGKQGEIIYEIGVNSYNGKTSVQLIIKDVYVK